MEQSRFEMVGEHSRKTVVVGAGPVGALAALYAASRGDEVEVYELRDGMYSISHSFFHEISVHLPYCKFVEIIRNLPFTSMSFLSLLELYSCVLVETTCSVDPCSL